MTDQLYVFIEGYKQVKNVAKLPPDKKPYIDYFALKRFVETHGEVKRMVLVGSELAGSLITNCQRAGFEVFTLPKYPDIKTRQTKEKGVDQKIGWEVAKTIFTNKDPVTNKKIVLCTGDKDFASILPDIHTSNWALSFGSGMVHFRRRLQIRSRSSGRSGSLTTSGRSSSRSVPYSLLADAADYVLKPTAGERPRSRIAVAADSGLACR